MQTLHQRSTNDNGFGFLLGRTVKNHKYYHCHISGDTLFCKTSTEETEDHRLCQMWQEVELNRLLVIILAKLIPFVHNKADLKVKAQEQIQEVAFLL